MTEKLLFSYYKLTGQGAEMMKTLYGVLLVSIMATLIFSSFQNIYVYAESSPLIRIDPTQTKNLSVGETFTINVTVENCVKVLAVQVDLRYDPIVLRMLNILEGPFLPSGGETFVINETRVYEDAEPPYGQVYYVSTILGEVPGVNGSGVLFTVTFEVRSDGSSHLELFEYPGGGVSIGTYFMDPELHEIIPDLYNGFYGTPILFSPSSSEVNVGENVTFSGQVLGVEEALNVTIYYRKQGGSWSALAILQANATGHFSYVWPTSESGVFEFKTSTVLEDVPVESSIVTVTVKSGDYLYLYIGVGIAIVIVIVLAFVLMRRRGRREETA